MKSGHGKNSVQRVANEDRLYAIHPARGHGSVKMTGPQFYIQRDETFPGGFRFISRSPRIVREAGKGTKDYQSLADVIASFALAAQRAIEVADDLLPRLPVAGDVVAIIEGDPTFALVQP
jgi:hypothetical protein